MTPTSDDQSLLRRALTAVLSYVVGDEHIRALQARAAMRPRAFGQGVISDTGFTNTVTFGGSTVPGPFYIPEAVSGEDFPWSAAHIVFDALSGSGRHTSFGPKPTAGGVGLQIPSGGGEMTLVGAENIRAFRAIGETGQTLNYAYQLYR